MPTVCGAPVVGSGAGGDFYWKAFINAKFLTLRISQIQRISRNSAAVDAHGYVIYLWLSISFVFTSESEADILISAWALRCLSSDSGNARALSVG